MLTWSHFVYNSKISFFNEKSQLPSLTLRFSNNLKLKTQLPMFMFISSIPYWTLLSNFHFYLNISWICAVKQKMKKSPGIYCDAKNRSSSTRLPCKNCAMNPTGKVNIKVSDLPSEHSGNVKVSDLPLEKPAYYWQDQGESSYHLYSTIENNDVYETPVNNTTVAVSCTGKIKDFNHTCNPLEIDEKYIMVTKPGASIGLEFHNTATLASFKAGWNYIRLTNVM